MLIGHHRPNANQSFDVIEEVELCSLLCIIVSKGLVALKALLNGFMVAFLVRCGSHLGKINHRKLI